MNLRVAVVGGGIIGMTSAVRILEALDGVVEVTVISENYTPRTTGDIAPGLFKPLFLRGMPEDKLRRWCVDSFDFYHKLLLDEGSENTGIQVVPAYMIRENYMVRPKYADAFLHYRDLTAKELTVFPSKYSHGDYRITLTIECKKFIPHLMERFRRRGGSFIQRKVNALEELSPDFDVVINCTGVGAYRLSPDPDVYPVRGQTVRVRAPWIKYAVVASEFYYIVPNINDVVLGTSMEDGNWSTIPDPATTATILEECAKLVPSVKNAQVLGEAAGLRPGRHAVRVESEDRLLDGSGKKLHIIHNYGHGGSGITLAWGSAGDALLYLQEQIRENLLWDITRVYEEPQLTKLAAQVALLEVKPTT